MKRAFVTAAAVLAPRIASACPSCVAQESTLPTTLKLVGLFILFPFLVVYLIQRSIRSAIAEDR